MPQIAHEAPSRNLGLWWKSLEFRSSLAREVWIEQRLTNVSEISSEPPIQAVRRIERDAEASLIALFVFLRNALISVTPEDVWISAAGSHFLDRLNMCRSRLLLRTPRFRVATGEF